MYLQKLSLFNFKNYEEIDISFSNRMNCFIGNNGVGKTNILDAIHYLALTKSYFNSVDSQNIMHNKDFAMIQGEFVKLSKTENIDCGLHRNKRKQFRRNKKEYDRLSDHIGLFPLVMISPADSSLINEGGDERRKFINNVIAQYDRNYLECVMKYNHALVQRNVLLKNLKSTHDFDRDLISSWDDQLIQYGDKVFSIREDFIKRISPVFSEYYNNIADFKEEVSLHYQSQLQGTDMQTLLDHSLRKDLVLRYSSSGIHKDDLVMDMGGFPLKKVGSQGQQKTFLVALKLAQFDFIKKISSISPVLLLDDIFDKFDTLRVEKIIRLVADHNFGQIFITDTNETHLKSILSQIDIDHKIFYISEDQKIATLL